jgi:hypothetical protein
MGRGAFALEDPIAAHGWSRADLNRDETAEA